MSNTDDKKKPSDKPGFTVDTSTQGNLADMPSITRLLNRKKLELTKHYPKPPMPPLDPPTATIAGIQKSPTAASPVPASASVSADQSPEAASPKVQTISQKTPMKSLIEWEQAKLSSGMDPLGRGIALLLEKGAKNVLFLNLIAPPPGSSVPHFLATAYAGDPERVALWTGLKWNPNLSPDLWNYFVRKGEMELAPPGTRTNQMSARNVIRGAFGANGTEMLLLLRAGPAESCRGVIAVFSDRSIAQDLTDVVKLTGQRAPGKRSA